MADTAPAINISVNGRQVSVTAQATVAAAIALAEESKFRRSVTSQPRGPLCGMGICFECRATIDGRANQRTCTVLCRPGMEVRTDA